MKGYFARKIIYALITLFVVVSLNFVIFQVLSPIDPKGMMVNPRFRSEVQDELLSKFGLDQPLHIRYIKYIINTFTLNFGYSFKSKEPVSDEILRNIGPTLLLMAAGLVITPLVGLPLGVLAASRRGSKLDVLATSVSLSTYGVPIFFTQLLIVLFFSLYLHLFPVSGMTNIPPPPFPSLEYVAQLLHHLALPALTLVVAGFGFWFLYVRNLMLDVLTQDFIVTARAKGLKWKTVLYKHAVRTILPAIFTMMVLSIPVIFWGTIMVEVISAWPGIGYWYLRATLAGDYPAVQGILFIYTILVISFNLLSDLVYGFLDPRIRVGSRR